MNALLTCKRCEYTGLDVQSRIVEVEDPQPVTILGRTVPERFRREARCIDREACDERAERATAWSLRVVGYQDGKRIVVDEGESRARVAGYGGSALGHPLTLTSVKHVPRSTVPLREKDRRRRDARLATQRTTGREP